jgi:hypothetical protein
MKFIWLLDSGVARSGKRLIHGQEHTVADYGEPVVAEWVRTGAAAYAGKKKTKGGEE